MGINLKIRRITLGKKQKDVAEAVGITTQYLRMIESGAANNPSREKMIKLAEELETTVQELFFD